MSGKFEPKNPVTLAPPKDDPITLEELAKADGSDPNGKTYVAIKEDPTTFLLGRTPLALSGRLQQRLRMSAPTGRIFLTRRKGVLNDWITFFSKRYNIVGRVAGATNFE
ncbi:uncharacterized protein N0V96_005129 [Colletotrichum fioriniae]|uniref:uncharacterized protein n=1 Tax=Colletotrichum fioriniae TaxID=710243 RepID=UPI0032DA6D67|nr:hypothetical protein N0V96_005129 [Colletotrichum fioriniae]